MAMHPEASSSKGAVPRASPEGNKGRGRYQNPERAMGVVLLRDGPTLGAVDVGRELQLLLTSGPAGQGQGNKCSNPTLLLLWLPTGTSHWLNPKECERASAQRSASWGAKRMGRMQRESRGAGEIPSAQRFSELPESGMKTHGHWWLQVLNLRGERQNTLETVATCLATTTWLSHLQEMIPEAVSVVIIFDFCSLKDFGGGRASLPAKIHFSLLQPSGSKRREPSNCQRGGPWVCQSFNSGQKDPAKDSGALSRLWEAAHEESQVQPLEPY